MFVDGLRFTGLHHVEGMARMLIPMSISYLLVYVKLTVSLLFRERTVGALITNGAASGALTDPTPQFPSGRTPADLASENGHKGIAGFLAESALTSHLSALTLKESKGCNVEELCETSEADGFAESSSGDLAYQDSQAEALKDSLSAVRKSTLAASRIFQAFRVESFHRKKVVEYGDDDCGLSDERTLSLVSLKNAKSGQNDMPHSAAVRIQNKFRGWKGRKEFMIIRQKIIKIQVFLMLVYLIIIFFQVLILQT
jgi:hypothetical protein